jgi:hypothetical protein
MSLGGFDPALAGIVGPFDVEGVGEQPDLVVASRCVELLQAELDCIRWPGVSADFGPGGVS